MSDLEAFLKPVEEETTQEFRVSERFRNKDGSVAAFVIRSIPQEQNDQFIKECTTRKKVNGAYMEKLDNITYQKKLLVACTVRPDFTSAELCKAYGVVSPFDVPGKMLHTGEYANLVSCILKVNGFKDEEDLEAEAKN